MRATARYTDTPAATAYQWMLIDEAISAIDQAKAARRNFHERWTWFWMEAGISINRCPAATQNALTARLHGPEDTDDEHPLRD